MTDSLSVLLLLEFASLNGGERSLLSCLDHLPRERFQFTAIAPPTGPLFDQLTRRQIPVQGTDMSGGRSLVARRSALERYLRNQRPQPDLVHANSLNMARLSGPVCQQCQLPSVGHLRDMIKVSRKTLDDLACHRRLIAVSEATRTWYQQLGFSGGPIDVLYNGVDLDQFQPRPPTGALHAELDLPGHSVLIGSIGQIGVRKGWDVGLGAFQQIAGRWPDTHFLIVGQRFSQKDEAIRYERTLHASAGAADLAGRVHFLGLRDDIARLLNELTVLVHAARAEPLGRVLLEAAACGLPVIATHVGGTSEIFPASQTPSAILVPPDDPDQLAMALNTVLEQPAIRRSLGQSARLRMEQQFDARQAAAALANCYRALCSS